MINAPVVLVPPVDRRRNSGTFKFTLSDQNGQFAFSSIPPGEYGLLAWEKEIESGIWANEEFLKSVEPRATKLALSKGSVSTPRVRAITR